ncbi:IS5 family transposase [Geobacter anodireducens]|uniref:IS5 family transposase n=1 Tax=Geobacter anodireducens TaxID=1340425 RepID=A0ABR9NT27_9BACT|nr:IS5 family transposase [Geobacter anodireducens]MBE2887409.1 IS5 family transposase [Geobacter anodireducens]
MKPKTSATGQEDLFRSRLDQILNNRHPLFRLANTIDWSVFDKEFGPLYVAKAGRPGLPIRLLVGLHYLKHAYNVSDETVVAQFIENGYWQYFCGFEHFQHQFPLDPTTLVKWRKRIGPQGMEKLLQVTIETAKGKEYVTEKDLDRVNVDTTVQEKAIAFPTDARLYHKARRILVRLAKRGGIELRQSYERLGKRAFIMQGRYSHARQAKRAKREQKRLRLFLGRVIRDIERKCEAPAPLLATMLERAKRIFGQKRNDTNKLYSMQAPEVECIAKGKAHKKYEFGCKVSLVSTSENSWIVGVQAVHGNPYDGHTLKDALDQAQAISGWRPQHAYCDKGYKGAPTTLANTEIHLANKKEKSMKASAWKWYRRRSGIEPIIGHVKQDHRMDRNYLKGEEGDKINAILAGCGFNIRKLLRAILLWLFKERFRGINLNLMDLLECFPRRVQTN